MERNEKLGRPVSPHVTIYAFPLAAWSSVGHRVTGGLLTIGMYGIGIGALAGVDVAHAMYSIGASGVAPLVKMTVAFPLAYHTVAGIRHLYWERFPEGLNPESQKQASFIVIGSATTVALVAGLL